MSELTKLLLKKLTCLYLEVSESVADDVMKTGKEVVEQNTALRKLCDEMVDEVYNSMCDDCHLSYEVGREKFITCKKCEDKHRLIKLHAQLMEVKDE